LLLTLAFGMSSSFLCFAEIFTSHAGSAFNRGDNIRRFALG
jgi:hypothetical protein